MIKTRLNNSHYTEIVYYTYIYYDSHILCPPVLNMPLTTWVFPASNKVLPETTRTMPLFVSSSRNPSQGQGFHLVCVPHYVSSSSTFFNHFVQKSPQQAFWVQHFKMLHKLGKYLRLRRLNFRQGEAVHEAEREREMKRQVVWEEAEGETHNNWLADS